jgi:hypothetical protein
VKHEPPGMKIPTVVAMTVAPIMGMLFLMFLPMVGFYLAGKALVERLLILFRRKYAESDDGGEAS